MRLNRQRLADLLLFAIAALLPFGTRAILSQGRLFSHPTEAGTISVYALWFVAVAYVWCASGLRQGQERDHGLPTVFAAAFLAVIAVVTVTVRTWLFGQGWADWMLLTIALAALVFATVRVHRPDPDIALRGLVAGGIVQGSLAIMQFVAQYAPASKWLGMAAHDPSVPGAIVIETASGRWLRAYGSFPHPNMLGLYLALAVIAAAIIASKTHARERWPYVCALPILAAGLFFSFSRGAVLALVVGAATLLVVMGDRGKGWVRGKALAALAIALLTFLVLSMIVREPLATRAAAKGRLEARSVTQRIDAFRDARTLFVTAPVFGIGPGMSVPAIAWIDQGRREWWQYEPVHDLPAVIAVETGAVGLALWLAFVLSALVAGRRSPALPLAAAVLAAGIFDHFLWTTWQGQLLFWLSFGLLCSGVATKEFDAH
jgi:hypothetical protein